MNRRRIGLAALLIAAGAVVRQRLKTRVDPGPGTAASESGADRPAVGGEEAEPTSTPPPELVSNDPTAADPTANDPTAPDPTANDPTAPDPTAADPTANDPTANDPTAADPTAPDPTAADPTARDMVVAADSSGDDVAWGSTATLGDPTIDDSVSAHVTDTAEPARSDAGSGATGPRVAGPGASTSLGDPTIDSTVPAFTHVADDRSRADVEQESAADDADDEPPPTVPAIVLPTMPAAGSRPDAEHDGATTAHETGADHGDATNTMADASPEPVDVPPTPLPLPTTLADSIASKSAQSTTAIATAETPAPSSDLSSFVPPPSPPPTSAPASSAPASSVPAAPSAVPVAPGTTPKAHEPFYRVHRIWTIVGSIMLGLLVTALIAASFVRLPYYRLEPGSVYDTIGRVEAPGDLVSIPNGEIGFVTVTQTANITPLQWLDAKLDNNVRIRHEDEVRGDQTADELREADLRRMQVSKNSAVVVALQKLGFELIVTPIGIEVAQVFDCTAADGTLGTGDLIVGVNGVEVLSGEALVEQLMNQAIGDEVDLLIERIDPANPTQSMRTDLVALTLGSADADCLPDDVRADEPRPFIGIGTLPMFEEELPIDVDLRTGRVSGPSAGLAFTLAIMDVLSEGDLTNGLNVVATGSIQRDGSVGPVGGIHQKTIAAERSGADVFIVPRCCDNFVDSTSGEPLDLPGNYDEALLYAEDMIVIGVDTLDEALVALGELGGDVDPFLNQETP